MSGSGPGAPIRRVGHKGADALVPGNSIASFERAVEVGVEMIEFDVLWLPDGRPEQDPSGRSPLVAAHDWHDAETRNPPAPTLEQALDAFTAAPLDRVELDCDIKLPGREPELVGALRERGLIERAMVSTPHIESLAAVRELAPELRRGWTYPKVSRDWNRKPLARPVVPLALALMRRKLPALLERTVAELEASAAWVYHPLISAAVVDAAARAGVELIAWTADDPARVAALRALGVDGICSNDPRLLA